MTPDSPNPQEQSPKPEITQLQANWHVHQEAMKAQEQAKAQGLDPATAHALLDAAAGGRRIGNVLLPPVPAALLLMLGKLDEAREQCPALKSGNGQLLALTFAVMQPDECWRILSQGDAAALEAQCFTTSRLFTLRELKQVNDWINGEIAALRGDAEDLEVEANAGKSSGPTGP